MSEHPIHVSLQASPQDAASWVDLARRCEDAGFRALLVSDHPGSGPSPFIALAAAATATATLRLGTYVLNAGIRDALLIAADTATLDVVSSGRAGVGIGAGHTPAEWEMTGRTRPDAAGRIRHLIDVAGAVRTLLDGETVPAADVGAVRDLVLSGPRPVQERVPLLVGGNHSDLLTWAGAHADAVGLSGLGRTLPDGHSHTVSWSPARIEATIAAVRSGADAAGRDVPPLEALVQVVTLTDDRRAAVSDMAQETGTDIEDLLAAPYLWVGTTEEIVEQVRVARQRWGISRWVVREGAFNTAGEVIARLGANS
ncbi:TIGR03621 family F420-dependent LLM class oxidoreductase [Kineococcus sp. GCM10028916]|uniref:TIGR03621 family F420-dependent LLM class oxidoreductase n=1 Tax=Kineococcus sp. GCM10028916 TaxID=3273394 RepID=UPI00362C5B10